MKIKVNSDLIAIINFITSYKYKLEYQDLVNWCISSGYYEDLYKNYILIHDLMIEHNTLYPDEAPKGEGI